MLIAGGGIGRQRPAVPALADPVGAKEYLDREQSRAAITSRHEWLFTMMSLASRFDRQVLEPLAKSEANARYFDFSAFNKLAPSGTPHPVQASQPGPAGNWPLSSPSVSLLPLVMSRSTFAGPIFW